MLPRPRHSRVPPALAGGLSADLLPTDTPGIIIIIKKKGISPHFDVPTMGNALGDCHRGRRGPSKAWDGTTAPAQPFPPQAVLAEPPPGVKPTGQRFPPASSRRQRAEAETPPLCPFWHPGRKRTRPEPVAAPRTHRHSNASEDVGKWGGAWGVCLLPQPRNHPITQSGSEKTRA